MYECDLAVEAGGRTEIAEAIRSFRNNLLAEVRLPEP